MKTSLTPTLPLVLLLLSVPCRADPAADLYSEGLRFKKAGNVDQAVAAMTRALELRPGYTAVHHSLGMLYRKKKDFGLAEVHLKKAIEQQPRWANAYYSLGILHHEQGKPDEALAAMTRAVELDPKDADALEQIGVLVGRKDPKKAVSYLEQAARLKPADAGVLHKLGLAQGRAGEVARAEATLLLAASKQLTAALAFDIGVHFRRKKEPEKALTYYDKAVALDPKMSSAYWDMALLCDSLEQLPRARKAYEAYLKLAPTGKTADHARKRLADLGL